MFTWGNFASNTVSTLERTINTCVMPPSCHGSVRVSNVDGHQACKRARAEELAPLTDPCSWRRHTGPGTDRGQSLACHGAFHTSSPSLLAKNNRGPRSGRGTPRLSVCLVGAGYQSFPPFGPLAGFACLPCLLCLRHFRTRPCAVWSPFERSADRIFPCTQSASVMSLVHIRFTTVQGQSLQTLLTGQALSQHLLT